MKQVSMEATVRTESGKGVARKLRQAGSLPAILYGPVNAPISLAVNAHEFTKIMRSASGDHILFTLDLKAGETATQRLALVKEIQTHGINGKARHVDFYEVFMDRPLKVEVPVVHQGKCKGVEIDKGIMDTIRRSVKVLCLPNAIPKEITLDITELRKGHAIHARELIMPADVKLADDPNATIITIVDIGEQIKEEAETEAEAETKA